MNAFESAQRGNFGYRLARCTKELFCVFDSYFRNEAHGSRAPKYFEAFHEIRLVEINKLRKLVKGNFLGKVFFNISAKL